MLTAHKRKISARFRGMKRRCRGEFRSDVENYLWIKIQRSDASADTLQCLSYSLIIFIKDPRSANNHFDEWIYYELRSFKLSCSQGHSDDCAGKRASWKLHGPEVGDTAGGPGPVSAGAPYIPPPGHHSLHHRQGGGWSPDKGEASLSPDKTLLLTVHSQLNIINDPEFISFPDRRMVCKLPWVPVFYFFHWDPQWIFNFRILPTVDTCSKFCEDTLYLQVKTIFRVSWRCTPVWPPWSLTTASCRSCCPLLWISTDITPPALTWTMTTPPSRTSPS